MQQRFNGQSAIITGAGQGIGFEIARRLAGEGAAVIINDTDAPLLQQAAATINSENGVCFAVPGDAADEQVIDKMVATAFTNHGSLDIVIANAGITLFGDFMEYSRASFEQVMRVNLGGTFFLAQAAARKMRTQSTGGSILFTSSVTAHQAHKNLAAYGMSKAAIEMLARNLVIELSPYHINVNTVAPGATRTERTAAETDYEQTWSAITPMGRPAYPSDIAAAALFLVSQQARHITGQTLIVDGGWTAISPSPY